MRAAWTETLTAPARAPRLRDRHVLISAVLVAAGMAGMLGGAWLVGVWCFGLMLMAESAGLLAVGLLRDDGSMLPWRGGAPTVQDILERESMRQ